MVDKKLSETESLNYTTEVPVYVAVVKYSDNTEQAITENRKIPLSQFAKDSLVLHNTGNENFTGTKTGQGINTPIALKRHGSSNPYTEIQTQNADGTRTGGFRNIQETDSTVNQTIMYVADGSSYKGSITINYDSANNEVWATLPKIQPFTVRKENSDKDGGQINFESADNEANAGKSMLIDRYDGKIRILGRNSSDTLYTPFQADVPNNTVFITNASISNDCVLRKNNGACRFISKDYGYAQGDTVSANRYSGVRTYDKNNVELGSIYTAILTSGEAQTSLYVKRPTAGATNGGAINIIAKPDGTFYTYAPTPSSATDNSTKIATTAFMTNRLHHNAVNGGRVLDTLFTGPIGTGNITLSHPYTDYDALMIIGGDDSGNYVASYIMTTKELNLIRSYNKPWKLWANANSYWYCAATSTTSSFVMTTENSRIEIIYGIKY